MPALYISHGAPTFALDPGPAGAALTALAGRIGRPEAIVVVSAHWDTGTPALGGALRPATLHDYWGFPRELYAIRYPAPGAPSVALDARNLLEDAGFQVALDLERGLDHGAWVPLRHMYPDATVPVVPLSMQSGLGPAHHHRLGRALAPLLTRGVLIVGSGSLTHNLHHYGRARAVPHYVTEFQSWIWERLAAGDAGSLLDYRRAAPGAVDAHPSDEHLLPLFVALGAAGESPAPERVFSGIYDRVLAMDSFALWPDARV